jgi:hypothetical protein
MNPVLTRQLGDRPVPLDRRQPHLCCERPVVLLACSLHVLLPRHRRLLRAGLHLSQLSHFRGPAQIRHPPIMAPIGAQRQAFLTERLRCSVDMRTNCVAKRARARGSDVFRTDGKTADQLISSATCFH